MMDYAMHIVKHLPSAQGKDNNPVILLVDGYVSRWDAALLLSFMQNNVSLFILASHTSVWSQPNNNMPNLWIHKCVKIAVAKLGLQYTGDHGTQRTLCLENERYKQRILSLWHFFLLIWNARDEKML